MTGLLFIADGRSPIAMNWIRYFLDRGDEVHLVSSFPCESDPRLSSYYFLPVALSNWKQRSSKFDSVPITNQKGSSSIKMRLRQWIGPLTLFQSAQSLARIIQYIQPDLIHAMRIPY